MICIIHDEAPFVFIFDKMMKGKICEKNYISVRVPTNTATERGWSQYSVMVTSSASSNAVSTKRFHS